jgi:hypothetical protein
MPRHAPELECSMEDRASLIALTKSRTADVRVVERARNPSRVGQSTHRHVPSDTGPELRSGLSERPCLDSPRSAVVPLRPVASVRPLAPKRLSARNRCQFVRPLLTIELNSLAGERLALGELALRVRRPVPGRPQHPSCPGFSASVKVTRHRAIALWGRHSPFIRST